MSGIKTVKDRERLKPKGTPYFEKLGVGQYIGFRKLANPSTGSWVARYQEDANSKRMFKKIIITTTGHGAYDAAVKCANKWFEHLNDGGEDNDYTVKDVCELYIENKVKEKYRNDVNARFNRMVYKESIASKKLNKLKVNDVQRWVKKLYDMPVLTRGKKGVQAMDRLRSKSTVHRDMASLRAALNYAYSQRYITSDSIWRESLKVTEGGGQGRSDYLTKEERQRLMNSAQPDLANFIRGLSLLPLRPGALARLKTKNLISSTGELLINIDKNGRPRKILLPPKTLDFFKQQCLNKTPEHCIFTRQDGTPWEKDYWVKKIKKAVIEAGLPKTVCAYTLRHSIITDLLTNGLDSLTVARLSDTSLQMIEKHYGHLLARHGQAALAELDL